MSALHNHRTTQETENYANTYSTLEAQQVFNPFKEGREIRKRNSGCNL